MRNNQECIIKQNSNSTSIIILILNIRMVSPEAHFNTKDPLRPPGAHSGSPRSFLLGVDALDSRATGDKYIQARRVNKFKAAESVQWRPVRISEVEIKQK